MTTGFFAELASALNVQASCLQDIALAAPTDADASVGGCSISLHTLTAVSLFIDMIVSDPGHYEIGGVWIITGPDHIKIRATPSSFRLAVALAAYCENLTAARIVLRGSLDDVRDCIPHEWDASRDGWYLYNDKEILTASGPLTLLFRLVDHAPEWEEFRIWDSGMRLQLQVW